MNWRDKPLLVTPSLLDSLAFFLDCPGSWKESAEQGLHDTLFRAPWRPTPEIEQGIAFENKIYEFLRTSQFVEDFVARVNLELPNRLPAETWLFVYRVAKGASVQQVTKKVLEVEGQAFLLYGKMDLRLPSKIVDLKTTGNYKIPDKYLKKTQHLAYCLSENCERFEYWVFEMREGAAASFNVIDASVNLVSAKLLLEDAIKGLVEFLEDKPEWKEAYLTKFNRF